MKKRPDADELTHHQFTTPPVNQAAERSKISVPCTTFTTRPDGRPQVFAKAPSLGFRRLFFSSSEGADPRRRGDAAEQPRSAISSAAQQGTAHAHRQTATSPRRSHSHARRSVSVTSLTRTQLWKRPVFDPVVSPSCFPWSETRGEGKSGKSRACKSPVL